MALTPRYGRGTAATDELEARRRARRNRHLRTHANGVETTGSFSGPTEEVADLLQTLKPLAEVKPIVYPKPDGRVSFDKAWTE